MLCFLLLSFFFVFVWSVLAQCVLLMSVFCLFVLFVCYRLLCESFFLLCVLLSVWFDLLWFAFVVVVRCVCWCVRVFVGGMLSIIIICVVFVCCLLVVFCCLPFFSGLVCVCVCCCLIGLLCMCFGVVVMCRLRL